MTRTLPHLNSYWVVPELVIAGEYPGSTDPEKCRARIRRHVECGVGTFVDLTEENELAPYREHLLDESAAAAGASVAHLRFPIRDADVPRSRDVMVSILDAIDAAARERPAVYVHCWGGIGRTGTVVGCYLVRHGYTGEAALARVAELYARVAKYPLHPQSPETDAQREYVLSWSETRA